jgi:hypothetical protein
MGEALERDEKQRAAAIVKGIGLAEAAVSVLAYGVLLLLSAWGARTFAEDLSTAPLFRFYGLFLLANLVYETSVGVLQTTDKFKQVAQANFYQSIAITVFIVAASIFNWGIPGVLVAYLMGNLVAGVWVAASAFRELNSKLGNAWIGASLKHVTNWGEMFRFAFSTNVNGTVNLFARDPPERTGGVLPARDQPDQHGDAAHRAVHLAYLCRDHAHHRVASVANDPQIVEAGQRDRRCMDAACRRRAGCSGLVVHPVCVWK